MKKNAIKIFFLLTLFLQFGCSQGGSGGGGDLGTEGTPEDVIGQTCSFLQASNFGAEAICSCPAGFLNTSNGFSCIDDPSLEVILAANQTSFDLGTQLINERGSVKIVPLKIELTNIGTKSLINPSNLLSNISIGNQVVRVRKIDAVSGCKSRDNLNFFQQTRCDAVPSCSDSGLNTEQQEKCDVYNSCQKTPENNLSQQELIECGERINEVGLIDDLPEIPSIYMTSSNGSSCNQINVGSTCSININLDPFEVGVWNRNFNVNYDDKTIPFSGTLTAISIGNLTESIFEENIIENDEQEVPFGLIGGFLRKVSLKNIVHQNFPNEPYPLSKKIVVTSDSPTGGLFISNPGSTNNQGSSIIEFDIRNKKEIFFYVKSNKIQYDDGLDNIGINIEIQDYEDNIVFSDSRTLNFERETNGNLFCWGDTTSTYLSDFDPRVSAKVELGTELAQDIYVGDSSVCITLTDGSSKCFGDNTFGKLAIPVTFKTDSAEVIPVKDVPNISALENQSNILFNFSTIAINERHSCAIENNKVYCWGHNEIGLLGVGLFTESDEPTNLVEERNYVTGRPSILEIEADSFGADEWKIVKTGYLPQADDVNPAISNIKTMASCAISLDGKLISCWGFADDEEFPTPTRVLTVLGNTTIEDFDLSIGGLCYKNNLGRVYCGSSQPLYLNRGCNSALDFTEKSERCDFFPFTIPNNPFDTLTQFQISNPIGFTSDSLIEVIYDDLADIKRRRLIVDLKVGPLTPNQEYEIISNSGLLQNDNQISGDSSSGIYLADDSGYLFLSSDINEVSVGELNVRVNGTTDTNIMNFSDIKISKMYTGEDHSCWQTESDKLYCFGKNDKGQVGVGNTNDQFKAVQVNKRDNSPLLVKSVSLGDGYSCAIEKISNNVLCWGYQNKTMPLYEDPNNPGQRNPEIPESLTDDKCNVATPNNPDNTSGELFQCLLQPLPLDFGKGTLSADKIDVNFKNACLLEL